MIVKTLTRLIIVAAICGAPSLASAQEALKIGVVNIGRLLQESPQAQAANARLEDEFAPRRREIIAMQTELEVKAAEMQKNFEVMGLEERENAQRDLRNDQRDLARAENEFREDLDLRRNEILGTIQRELIVTIQEFGTTSGFDLILGEGILFRSDRTDVTQQLLDTLKSKASGSGGQ